MEQKRTLWIIAAVGVFLLVVLGAALILYSPAARSRQTIANYQNETRRESSDNGWISLAPSEEKTDSGYYLNRNDFSGQENQNGANKNSPAEPAENTSSETNTNTSTGTNGNVTRIGELTVYVDNVTLNKNQTSVNGTDNGQSGFQNSGNSDNATTIDLTNQDSGKQVSSATPAREKTGIVSSGTQKTSAEKNTEIAVKSSANTNSGNVNNADAAAKSVARNTKTQAESKASSDANTRNPNVKTASNAANSAAAKKTVETTQYWVQVTSLTSRKNADAAREVLGENKIPADVFTYTDSKNQLFYRVRVGPYTTKSEAEYWQTRIAKIDSFKDSQSYVAQTKVTN